MVEKWDPVPEPQDLRDPRDSQGPFMTSGSHWDTRDLLEHSQDPFQPPEHLETPRTTWDPENLPENTGIPRDVIRKKYFSRMIRFLFLQNSNFSIIKASQF